MTSPAISPSAFHPRACEASPVRVIGFCGLAGAGKSTAACHIVATRPGWHRFSFADPIRAMLLALGLDPKDFTHERKELPHPLLCGKSPRFAMQKLGTEWGRDEIGQDIWIRAAKRQITGFISEGGAAVIDDVRFDNEAELIHRLGGQVVHIGRPGHHYAAQHASERGVTPDLVDFWIEAADVPELHAKIDIWLNHS